MTAVDATRPLGLRTITLAAVAFAVSFGSWQESLFGTSLPRIVVPILFFQLLAFGSRVAFSQLTILIAAFAIVASPSLILGDGFTSVFLNFIGYVLLAIVALNSLNDTMRLRSVVMAYAIGLGTVAFFSYVALLTPFDLGATLVGEGLARQIFGIKRLVGTEENQNAFALYFTCGMPIALYACGSSRGILGRLIWIVLFVGFLVGAMLTLSRGAMLGGLAAVVVWLAYRQPSQSLRLKIFAAAMALLGVAAWLLASSETFALLTSLDNAGIASVIEDKSFSTQTRVTMLQTLFDIYLDNPIVGIGYGHLPELVNEYIGQRLGAHNIFIGIGIELGVVALLAFCGVILFALSLARHAALFARDAMTRDLAALLLAMLVGQMTNGLVHESYINFLLWLNIALIGALPLCCSATMTPDPAPRR